MSDKRRSNRASSSKAKKIKIDEHIEVTSDEEESSAQKTKDLKRLITLSQPILKKDLKNKLHTLLANWKPPLKNVSQKENQNFVLKAEINDTNMENKGHIDKTTEMFQNLKKSSKITDQENLPSKSTVEGKSQDDNSFESNHNLAIENIKEKLIFPKCDTKSYNATTILANQHFKKLPKCFTIQTSNAKEKQSVNPELQNDDNAAKQILPVSKSEDFSNEITTCVNQSETNDVFLTPEQTAGTPPTPPTIKIIWPNENVHHAFIQGKSEETQDITKSPTKHIEMSNETKERENIEPVFQKIEKVNLNESSENHGLTEKPEEIIVIKHSDVNTVDITEELENDMNISNSQLESIENSILSSVVKQRKSTQVKSVNFTPVLSRSFEPKMPQLNWIRQIQEDKRRLQAIVREVSQINAMMTRVVREIWPAEKSS